MEWRLYKSGRLPRPIAMTSRKPFVVDEGRARALALGNGVDSCSPAVDEQRNIVGRQACLASLADRGDDAAGKDRRVS